MEIYIKKIIELSKIAYKKNEIPVGCIIVKNNKIIGKGYNLKEKTKKVTKHAEIIAIEQACKSNKSWYLNDCDMYVTLEPCKMCCGAIEQSHIKNVYYLINNEKFGDIVNINEKINCYKIENEYSILYENILKNFFKSRRK